MSIEFQYSIIYIYIYIYISVFVLIIRRIDDSNQSADWIQSPRDDSTRESNSNRVLNGIIELDRIGEFNWIEESLNIQKYEMHDYESYIIPASDPQINNINMW